jgi:Zn-dependent peptidase ImmA (M78 family)/transcriptional regulator with XRE-family HTH domain
MLETNFNPEMLILARESWGFSQTELAELVAVNQGTISRIEAGLLSPSDDILKGFAEQLEFPEKFFTQSDKIYGFNSTVFFHRKRQSLADKVLRRLHAQMNLCRMRIDRLTRSIQTQVDFRFVHMEPVEYAGGVAAIARLVRSTWLLPPGPVRNLTQAIEEAGGIVVEFDFQTKQADAISEWVPGFAPMFLVNSNSNIPWDRRRLTLAHELGHVILHKFPDPKMEEEANEFAAEFLMPRRDIKPSLFGLTMAKLADLKRVWKVSMQALIERAYQLKTITEYQRRLFYVNLNRGGRSRIHEPLENEYPPERPEVFRRLVRTHLEILGYSLRELALLLFMTNEQRFRLEILGEQGLSLVG